MNRENYRFSAHRAIYGKLQVVENREAADLWRARHEEPEPDPAALVLAQLPDPLAPPDEDVALGRRAWAVARHRLGCRDCYILHERIYSQRTLEDIGKDLGVTRERIRNLESMALRRLRGMSQQNVQYPARLEFPLHWEMQQVGDAFRPDRPHWHVGWIAPRPVRPVSQADVWGPWTFLPPEKRKPPEGQS